MSKPGGAWVTASSSRSNRQGPPSSILQAAKSGGGGGRGSGGGGRQQQQQQQQHNRGSRGGGGGRGGNSGRGGAGAGRMGGGVSGSGRGGGASGGRGGGGGGRSQTGRRQSSGRGNNRSSFRNNNDSDGNSNSKNRNSGPHQNSGNRNQNQNQNPNQNQNQNSSNNANNSSNTKSNNNQRKPSLRVSFKSLEEIELLNSTGHGTTDQEKCVIRLSVSQFLSCRMEFLEPPAAVPEQKMEDEKAKEGEEAGKDASSSAAAAATASPWVAPKHCGWKNNEERSQSIENEMKVFWDFKPLEVNEETRWKAKIMEDDGQDREKSPVELSVEEKLSKALGILNKLSWTTLDKLTVSFLEALGVPPATPNSQQEQKDGGGGSTSGVGVSLPTQVVRGSMELIVEKALQEPHFAELYARFCGKLAAVHKSFRNTLLELCRDRFEESRKRENAFPAADDLAAAAAAYESNRTKKRSIGLMKFIGELYQLSLIKASIMVSCLEGLCRPDDEEKLECFAKLMTTAGSRLDKEKENNSNSNNAAAAAASGSKGNTSSTSQTLRVLWDQVYSMAGRRRPKTSGVGKTKERSAAGNNKDGPVAPSNRIKFLLQDLVDLRESGWVQRRKEEKAKTIEQIHREVAEEEQAAAALRKSFSGSKSFYPQQSQAPRMSRSQSSGVIHKSSSQSSLQRSAGTATVDEDGFTQIAGRSPNSKRAITVASTLCPKSEAFVPSMTGLHRATSAPSLSKQQQQQQNSPRSSGRKSPSISNIQGGGGSRNADNNKDDDGHTRSSSQGGPPAKQRQDNLPDPAACGEKIKSILKEYFVGGDTADAVLSVDELVARPSPGHVERGAAVVESAVLLVLEMKEEHVEKALRVLGRCLSEDRIDRECLIRGLNEPLELLRDIEIDAPRSPQLLATVVADWVGAGHLPSLAFLASAPDYFLTDGRAADFYRLILTRRGGDPVAEDVELAERLMTAEERKEHPDVREWLLSS